MSVRAVLQSVLKLARSHVPSSSRHALDEFKTKSSFGETDQAFLSNALALHDSMVELRESCDGFVSHDVDGGFKVCVVLDVSPGHPGDEQYMSTTDCINAFASLSECAAVQDSINIAQEAMQLAASDYGNAVYLPAARIPPRPMPSTVALGTVVDTLVDQEAYDARGCVQEVASHIVSKQAVHMTCEDLESLIGQLSRRFRTGESLKVKVLGLVDGSVEGIKIDDLGPVLNMTSNIHRLGSLYSYIWEVVLSRCKGSR